MRQISVAFYWHMHQPYYRDRLTGNSPMPFVRLHSTKGYYDMVSLLEDFPEISQTFNLVPSLITQIVEYAEGYASDDYLAMSEKPAEDLDLEERKFVLGNFFKANWDTMIRPHQRYWELLYRRGLHVSAEDLEQAAAEFNAKDFRDIQVWFNLTWFGYRARRRFPELTELIRKGRHFTEQEKLSVLAIQRQILGDILNTYKRAQERGQIEITVSPFYHPILPLLYDSRLARRCLPEANLPETPFYSPDDAKAQVEKGIQLYSKVFGEPPKGMWPPEGSVCPELIPVIAEAGIQWIATDEEILLNSSPQWAKGEMYRPFRAENDGRSVGIVFRDRGLSDLIGFTYSKNKPADACEDLMFHLRRIAEEASHYRREALVCVILDGENAWEVYPDGGEEFLARLYRRLTTDPFTNTTQIGRFLEEHPPERVITELDTGSWINHNFEIWIGGAEENTAWDYLRMVREALKDHLTDNPGVDKGVVARAWEEVYMAEGSDWFWWLGESFSTDSDVVFDRLFRLHLSNVFRILGAEIPDYLNYPILTEKKVKVMYPPIGLISPTIDGQVTDFYEWHEAGLYDSGKAETTMHRREHYVSHIYYGFDLQNFYVRVDPVPAEINLEENLKLTLRVIGPNQTRITIPLSWEPEQGFILERSYDGVVFESVREYTSMACGSIIEFAIPFEDLDLIPDERVDFYVSVFKGKLQLGRYPSEGHLSVIVPGEEFETEMWSA